MAKESMESVVQKLVEAQDEYLETARLKSELQDELIDLLRQEIGLLKQQAAQKVAAALTPSVN